jgi:succinyl-diaminopimelate desuccinylase
VEAGCQGTLRVDVTHRASGPLRPVWTGVNAIHGAGRVLARLNAYEPRTPVIDGLEYHEGLNAVFISGGVAGNVLPDVCTVSVNYRFAPTGPSSEAAPHVREVFDGYDVELTDSRPARCPGSSVPGGRRSSRPSAARRTPSSAGPTSPGSARWASRR